MTGASTLFKKSVQEQNKTQIAQDFDLNGTESTIISGFLIKT